MRCNHCRTEISEDDRFCAECGEEIQIAPEPEQSSPGIGNQLSDIEPDSSPAQSSRSKLFPIVPLAMILVLNSVSRYLLFESEDFRIIFTFLGAVIIAVLAGLCIRARKIPLSERTFPSLAVFFTATLLAIVSSDIVLFSMNYDPGLFRYIGSYFLPGVLESAVIAVLVFLISRAGKDKKRGDLP